MNKKNIILIATDGVRIDRINNFENFVTLSKKGSFFPRSVSYAPYSVASFHAIFSGIYGNKSGVDNYHGSFHFDENCKTLTSYLKDAGYYTVGDVMNKIVVPKQGFDELTIADPNGDILPRHKEMLQKCGQVKKDGGKFFAFLHCDYVHNSLIRDVVKKYDDFSEEYFNNKESNAERYDSYIRDADNYLQVIFDEIKKQGIEDSLILIFSDHGCSLGDKIGEKVYGSFCYDYTILTFAIFLGCGFPEKEFSQVIRTVDYMPTLLELIGIPLDKNKMELDGRSVVPIIKGEETNSRLGFSETGGLGGPYPSPSEPNVHCVRTDKWKLIFNKTPKTYELYNLEKDPNEKKNLHGGEESKEIEKYLLKELRRKIIKVGIWQKQK